MSNYADYFYQTLEIERDAIGNALKNISLENIEKAISILASCHGKVLVIGVGKSGIIGKKIAATLTSTGTPAIYLHPTDSLHGDLGIASPGDVAILISNSGETEELVGVFPYLRERAIPTIAIVGNVQSTLALRSDAMLNAGVEKEACSLNLAPTASTTLALAIGDGLAVTLMRVKGIRESDFAVNHPAGALGKRLTLRVSDLMHTGEERPLVGLEASWVEVVEELSSKRMGVVLVVGDNEELKGIITDGDFRQAARLSSPERWSALTAAAMMTHNPISIEASAMAYDALQLMQNRMNPIACLPVIDNRHVCVGLVLLHDVIKLGL